MANSASSDNNKFLTDLLHEIEELGLEPESKTKQCSNQFPVHVLPIGLQKIINACGGSLNFNPDFLGSSILAASSIAIGNTCRVEVMSGWQESALLYIALVGGPGTNKSHPLGFALRPILKKDEITYTVFESEKKEYDKVYQLSKKEREEQGLDEPVKPYWNKHVVQDVTPEALVLAHKNNKRGIIVYADELASWFKNFNRYNKGSEQEFWLSNFSGKPIIIDRKSSEPILIPQPYIPVVGTIQTGILDELSKDNRSQNGFIDRILFAIPHNLQKQYWQETPISPVHITRWNTIISNLLEIPLQLDENLNPSPALIKFSTDAWNKLKDWQIRNTDLCNKAANDSIAGIYSKLEIYVIRLSLVIQLLKWACDEAERHSINLESVEGAITITEYFRSTAVKVNTIITKADPLGNQTSTNQKLYNALPSRFTTAEGLHIAIQLDYPERTFKNFIKNKDLFEKVDHGEYEKKI